MYQTPKPHAVCDTVDQSPQNTHARIQEFLSGGDPGPTAPKKQPGPSAYFTVYRGGPMILLQRKLYFPKDPEGVQHFPGGGGPIFMGGGSKC